MHVVVQFLQYIVRRTSGSVSGSGGSTSLMTSLFTKRLVFFSRRVWLICFKHSWLPCIIRLQFSQNSLHTRLHSDKVLMIDWEKSSMIQNQAVAFLSVRDIVSVSLQRLFKKIFAEEFSRLLICSQQEIISGLSVTQHTQRTNWKRCLSFKCLSW